MQAKIAKIRVTPKTEDLESFRKWAWSGKGYDRASITKLIKILSSRGFNRPKEIFHNLSSLLVCDRLGTKSYAILVAWLIHTKTADRNSIKKYSSHSASKRKLLAALDLLGKNLVIVSPSLSNNQFPARTDLRSWDKSSSILEWSNAKVSSGLFGSREANFLGKADRFIATKKSSRAVHHSTKAESNLLGDLVLFFFDNTHLPISFTGSAGTSTLARILKELVESKILNKNQLDQIANGSSERYKEPASIALRSLASS
jgi:hypothetical protein